MIQRVGRIWFLGELRGRFLIPTTASTERPSRHGQTTDRDAALRRLPVELPWPCSYRDVQDGFLRQFGNRKMKSLGRLAHQGVACWLSVFFEHDKYLPTQEFNCVSRPIFVIIQIKV